MTHDPTLFAEYSPRPGGRARLRRRLDDLGDGDGAPRAARRPAGLLVPIALGALVLVVVTLTSSPPRGLAIWQVPLALQQPVAAIVDDVALTSVPLSGDAVLVWLPPG
jgi:hypothetical protein